MVEQQNNPFDGMDLGSSRHVHLADQAGGELLLMAGLLAIFYKSLLKEGLPEDFAQSLVYEWFIGVIGISHEQD